MNFKFELGDKVKLKGSNKSGEVKGRKFEEYVHKASTTLMIRYYVNLGGYFTEWYSDDKLEALDTFDNKFEVGLINELIDGNLATGNYEEVKRLNEVKQKYTK